MPLYNPHNLVNPYAAGFNAWPLPDAVKIETGPPSDFTYVQQDIRADNATIITLNRGELETNTQRGDLLSFRVPVHTDTESYFETVIVQDIQAGGTTLIPIADEGPEGEYAGALVYEPYAIEQTPHIPYEDLSGYNYGQGGGYTETAQYVDPYTYSSPSYTPAPPETSAPYVPPPPDNTTGESGSTAPEVADPQQQQQDQAAQDWLDYTRALEEMEAQYGYYGQGSGEIV